MDSQDVPVIKVADFTELPGARYRSDGDGSAEQFYEEYIKPFLDSLPDNSNFAIDFDGTWGYASSFISEMAIQLVDRFGSKDALRTHLTIKSEDDLSLEDRFWDEVDSYEAKDKS